MRYILITVFMLVLAGCGGSNSTSHNPSHVKDNRTVPPTVPNV